ncbi:serine/threonine-protein kinase-like protein At5g23170 [Juglans microcarpa x Juglans regia]|uniref:serine/threonine-protein kinase-like protein At5g23170 n=1 Tax=Juglans microcarpa x Juglans regia TaxID=2249226 RepID=UPI001B7D9284|nr:serine/threonine-protein kinase-like protein At5g23170 [Juglans microcarpa x Juglans regia]
MEKYDYEELVNSTQSFSPTRLIGRGSHGSVYKGVLKDNKLVAIKKPTRSPEALHDKSKLDNEIRVLSSLRENPHVINLLGTSQDSANGKLLVMELMPNGSLHDLLHISTAPPTWPKRVEIATQIARAVCFLHEGLPLVIHRDIKSANILFDSNWNSKLADFGLAVLQLDSPSQVSQPAGTIGYLDPCYTTPSKLSTKNDVFSLGVVLLEIISGRKAIDMSRAPSSIVEWAIPLIKDQVRISEICDPRIALPPFMEPTIRHMLCIAARCVSSNEDQIRPSVAEIITLMENPLIHERVRFPIWTCLLRRMVLPRRRRKLASRLQARSCAATKQGDHHVHSHLSSGTLLLKEVLADVTHK